MLHGEGIHYMERSIINHAERGTLHGDGYIIEKDENYYRHKSVLNK